MDQCTLGAASVRPPEVAYGAVERVFAIDKMRFLARWPKFSCDSQKQYSEHSPAEARVRRGKGENGRGASPAAAKKPREPKLPERSEKAEDQDGFP
jgi:hypothetical protein